MSLCLTDDYNTAPMQREIRIGDARKQQLREMIQKSYSEDEEAAAAMALNEFLRLLTEQELGDLVNQHQIAGPLAHLLAKFLQSANANVVLNASVILSQMMREDKTRRTLCKSGLHQLILKQLEFPASAGGSSKEANQELFACVQNILLEGDLAKDLASRGGLRVLGNTLQSCLEDVEQQRNVRLELLVLAAMANATSHVETQQFTHEMRNWIANLVLLLGKLKLPLDAEEAYYCMCAIANASRDPGLLHCIRASNGAEGLERMRFGDDLRIRQISEQVLARLQFNAQAARTENGGSEDMFRFKFGGGKITNQQRALGMVALLLVSTVALGLAVLLLWRLTSF
ncbi:hypothetical protein BASA81_003932 [Batrachochytrium salamandrivorans]|nr:hypothetical protein BASA81_003932 [Batrachochytrium salamandrivorans]